MTGKLSHHDRFTRSLMANTKVSDEFFRAHPNLKHEMQRYVKVLLLWKRNTNI
jgi:hypothetical protein